MRSTHMRGVLAMAVLLLVVVSMCLSSTMADAKDCKLKKGHSVWRHGGGTFRRVKGTLLWEETNEKGEKQSVFEEKSREGGGLIIHNAEREISILLRDDLAGIQNKGQHGFQQLYQGSWAKLVDCT